MQITATYSDAAHTAVAVEIVEDDGTVRQITGDLPLAGPFATLLDGVTIGAYQPPPAPIRLATTFQLLSALTTAQRTAYPNNDGWDQRLFTARDTPWPESDPQIARMAGVMSTTPKAWFDAALAPPTS